MHPPPGRNHIGVPVRCELLSDFVYSFFEHNPWGRYQLKVLVVNCFQILYIRSLNTIRLCRSGTGSPLWIAFRFCIFVLWTQFYPFYSLVPQVVNCFQILYIRSLNTILRLQPLPSWWLWIAFRFCIFVLWTQYLCLLSIKFIRCELLSDFVYSFFEHNGQDL